MATAQVTFSLLAMQLRRGDVLLGQVRSGPVEVAGIGPVKDPTGQHKVLIRVDLVDGGCPLLIPADQTVTILGA